MEFERELSLERIEDLRKRATAIAVDYGINSSEAVNAITTMLAHAVQAERDITAEIDATCHYLSEKNREHFETALEASKHATRMELQVEKWRAQYNKLRAVLELCEPSISAEWDGSHRWCHGVGDPDIVWCADCGVHKVEASTDMPCSGGPKRVIYLALEEGQPADLVVGDLACMVEGLAREMNRYLGLCLSGLRSEIKGLK